MEQQTAGIIASKQVLDTESETCQSCGKTVEGKYCANCGEKQLDRHDFAMKHYLEESFEGITHFDNKFFRTAKLLIARPGLLTLYFSQGKRIGFVKPFQMFVICNILFYFAAGSFNLFSTPFSGFYNHTPYIRFNTRPFIQGYAKTENQLRDVALQFNEKMGTESKEFTVVFIPIIAMFCWLLFIGRKKYFSEHLVFATHFLCFTLLYFGVYSFIATRLFWYFTHQESSSVFDEISAIVYVVVMGLYFTVSAKRFYQVKWWQGVLAALCVDALFVIALFGYRMLLFYKIFYEIAEKTHTA